MVELGLVGVVAWCECRRRPPGRADVMPVFAVFVSAQVCATRARTWWYVSLPSSALCLLAPYGELVSVSAKWKRLQRSFVKLVLPHLVSLRAVTSYCIISASHRRSHALPAAGGSQVQLFMPLVSCAAVTSVLEPQPALSVPVCLVDRLSPRRAL